MEDSDVTYRSLRTERQVEQGIALRKRVYEAAERFPEHLGLRSMRATCRLWSGDLANALKDVQSLASVPDLDASTHADMAMVLAFDGQIDRALKHYRQSLEIDPDNFDALRQFGGLLATLGQNEEAEAMTHRALAAYPENPLILSSAAHIGILLGDAEIQSNALAALDRHCPDHPATHLVRCRQALRIQDYGKAEGEGRLAVAGENDLAPAWESLALIYKNTGRWAEAKEAAEIAISLNSRAKVALSQLEAVYLYEGNKELAQEFADRASKAIPMLHRLNELSAANRLMRKGDRRAARDIQLKLADSKDPLVRRAARVALIAYIDSKIEDDAVLDILDQMEREGVTSQEWWAAKAKVYMDSGDLDETERILAKGLEAHPSSSWLRARQIEVQIDRGEDARIEDLLNRLVTSPLSAPVPYSFVVNRLLYRKRTDQAQMVSDLMNRRFPNATMTLFVKLSVARAKSDRTTVASVIQELTRRGALILEPPHPSVVKRLLTTARRFLGLDSKKK